MQAVSVDALTGVGLRDGMALYLRESLQRSQLEQHPVALLVIDVDYLKLLNDAFGHQTGDKALLTVVDVVRTHLADAGQVFRYGGDEFVVVLPNMSLDAASDWARALLTHLQASPFFPAAEDSANASSPISKITSLTLSLSIGVAELIVPANASTADTTAAVGNADGPKDGPANKTDPLDPLGVFANQLFEQADRRAYLSKRAGRGRVTDSDAFVVAQDANTRLLGREGALEQLRAFVRAPSGDPNTDRATALPIYGPARVGFSQFLEYAQTLATLLAEAVVYVPATHARSNRHLGALSEAVFSVPWLSWRDLTEPETVLWHCAHHERRLLLIVDRIDLLDAGSLLSLRHLLAAGGVVRLICSAVHGVPEDIKEYVVLEPAITLTPLSEADGIRWLSSRLASQLASAQSNALWQAIFALTLGLPARIQQVFAIVDAGLIAPHSNADEVVERLRHFLNTRGRRSHVPLSRNLFFGREEEIKTITRALQAATLVTIVAAHGMGKSRLAAQVATEYGPKLLGGVVWLSLQGISNYEQCLYALAEGLDVPVGNSQDPQAPVFHALQHLPTLLVCDDASPSPHVLALLEAIRQNAPATRLLATSREPLSLAGEQCLMLEGLPAPTATLTSSSYQLFMAHVRQVTPEQSWPSSGTANQIDHLTMTSYQRRNIPTDAAVADTLLPALERIHEIVAGMPLGLELAAAWCEAYDIPTIADKLSQDALLLGQAASPLQAMFTTFWRLLAPYEQRTLASLTVFPSHFPEGAAAKIAGASPFFLTSLWHKAFLRQHTSRHQDDGRYAMPLLLRQFASAQLAAKPSWQRRVKRALVRYYVGWLRELEPTLWDDRQSDTVARIHAEIDAIDKAWGMLAQLDPPNSPPHHAVRLDPDGKATMLLRNYYEKRGHIRRGAQLFDGLRQAFAGRHGRFASFHAYAAARLWSRAGDLVKSQAAIEQARALLEDPANDAKDATELAWLGVVQGTNALSAGQLEGATSVLDAAVDHFASLQFTRGWAAALITRAMVDHQQTNFKAARQRFLRAEWHCRREGIRGELSRSLYLHGMMCVDTGNWREARRLFRAGLARAQLISLAPVMSLCHVGLARCALHSNGLGKIALTLSGNTAPENTMSGDTIPVPLLREAETHLAAALHLIEPSASMIAFMHTLCELANVAWVSGAQQEAMRHFIRALTIVKGSPFVPSCLQLLAMFAWHHPTWRARIVPVIYHHPAASVLFRQRIAEQFATDTTNTTDTAPQEVSPDALINLCDSLLEHLTDASTKAHPTQVSSLVSPH